MSPGVRTFLADVAQAAAVFACISGGTLLVALGLAAYGQPVGLAWWPGVGVGAVLGFVIAVVTTPFVRARRARRAAGPSSRIREEGR